MGGFSQEYDISIESGKVVCNHLDTERYNVYPLIITREKWFVREDDGAEHLIDKNDLSFTKNGEKVKFDAVFNVVHGAPGEDGPLAGYLELLGIPQTSSSHFESALTFNKAECSMLLKGQGVNIAEAYYLARHEEWNTDEILEAVGLPCFVKPNRSGSSFGVSKVKEEAELEAAINKAFEIDSQIIIESMVSGTEVACGVSNYNGNIESMAITHIIPKNEFFDYESKYNGESEEVTPAKIDSNAYEQIMEESAFIYESLNLNGIARVDYIVTENGVPFMIEVNTIPGLSSESLVPKQANYRGISLDELFNKCVENALNSRS